MPTRLLEPRTAPRPAGTEPATDPSRLVARVMETSPEVYLAICRLLLGGIMFAHATQKLLGWFGGPGFTATIESFRSQLGIPLILAVLAVFVEFLGSVGLILGFLGRAAAVCIITVMVGAILVVHLPNGFFMNWTGSAPGEGFEYHLLAIGLAIPILARGSGAFSLDLWLHRQVHQEPAETV